MDHVGNYDPLHQVKGTVHFIVQTHQVLTSGTMGTVMSNVKVKGFFF